MLNVDSKENFYSFDDKNIKLNFKIFVSKSDSGTNLLAVLTVKKCLQQTLTPFPSAEQ